MSTEPPATEVTVSEVATIKRETVDTGVEREPTAGANLNSYHPTPPANSKTILELSTGHQRWFVIAVATVLMFSVTAIWGIVMLGSPSDWAKGIASFVVVTLYGFFTSFIGVKRMVDVLGVGKTTES
jgi:hypothetical protein